MGHLYSSLSLVGETCGSGGELGNQSVLSGPDLIEDHPFIELFDSLTWNVMA